MKKVCGSVIKIYARKKFCTGLNVLFYFAKFNFSMHDTHEIKMKKIEQYEQQID